LQLTAERANALILRPTTYTNFCTRPDALLLRALLTLFSARRFRLVVFGSLFSARSFRLALPAVTPLLQEARDRPHQWGERELLPRHPLRLLVRELTLAFAEE